LTGSDFHHHLDLRGAVDRFLSTSTGRDIDLSFDLPKSTMAFVVSLRHENLSCIFDLKYGKSILHADFRQLLKNLLIQLRKGACSG
jgi:hypothetical protein